MVVVVLNHADNVHVCKLSPVKLFDEPCTTISSVSSKSILPPFPESNVGPLVNVPLLLPAKSLHVVPLPGYDFLFAASTAKTKPSVTIFGENENAFVID